MDRTGLLGSLFFIILLFFWYEYVSTAYPTHLRHHRPVAAASGPGQPATLSPGLAPAEVKTQTSSAVSAPEAVTLLQNEAIRVTLSSVGASVKTVELKRHQETDNHAQIILNDNAREGIFTLHGWGQSLFTVKSVSPDSVTYASDLPGSLHWERTYTLGQAGTASKPDETESLAQNYTLTVADVLTNGAATEVTLPPYSLSVGKSDPLHIGQQHVSANSNALYLGAGWLTSHFHTLTVSNFNPGSFFWIPTHPAHEVISSTDFDQEPVRWVAAQNQFFASLLIPAPDRLIQRAEFRCFNERDQNGNIPPQTDPEIETLAWLPELKIPAGQTISLPMTLYVGPKEYNKLSTLGPDETQLMNYGYFEPLIVGFLYTLRFFHGIVGNWGVAIILLTLMVKVITWPLQSFANQSAKKMQALAPMAKELQAKYKEQPEKITAETMALYRDYGVNPLSGCLPALIQMPVFFSLYFMLQSVVELRGSSFLWAHDLTLPDTILSFMFLGVHFALNPLPLMVTGTTMGMMRLSPMASADPQQAFIAKNVMPMVFLFIFYNFASALSLYYVVNNSVSMFQIYRNLKKPMPLLKRQPRK